MFEKGSGGVWMDNGGFHKKQKVLYSALEAYPVIQWSKPDATFPLPVILPEKNNETILHTFILH